MHRWREQRLAAVGLPLLAAIFLLAACGGGSATQSESGAVPTCNPASQKHVGTLNGSGSTFQLVFMQTAIDCFRTIQPNMTVNYGGGGSGKGRTDLASGVVDYAGSDSPIPASEQANFSGPVLYFPTVIAPITISYNLPNVNNLHLTGPVLAKIFQAQITSWNDPEIASLNPNANLPNMPITVARRSDSSGTTQNFSEFLVKSAPGVWTLGTASTISWPASTLGGNGNGGVASLIQSTAGSIGYVDYSDARASHLVFASVKDLAGDFVKPSIDSAKIAADHTTIMPDLTFSAIWAPGSGAYPITYQSWILVNQHQTAAQAPLVKAWISYLIGDGQSLLPSLNYAPLPPSLQTKAKAQVDKIGATG